MIDAGGGNLRCGPNAIGAAFAFIGEMMPDSGEGDGETIENLADALKTKLGECMETGADGRMKMTVTFPNETVLDEMARSLARIVGAAGKPSSVCFNRGGENLACVTF